MPITLIAFMQKKWTLEGFFTSGAFGAVGSCTEPEWRSARATPQRRRTMDGGGEGGEGKASMLDRG
jgi:hypothetical protein